MFSGCSSVVNQIVCMFSDGGPGGVLLRQMDQTLEGLGHNEGRGPSAHPAIADCRRPFKPLRAQIAAVVAVVVEGHDGAAAGETGGMR